MKLVKAQREILEASLAVWESRGENVKPISVFKEAAVKNSGYAKSFETYAIQMEKLVDAGIIERRQPNAQYAYLVDKELTKKVLAA